ncbi:putative vacuolar protein sorting-associated protein 41 [Trypanosoma theileri]|uniref:Putative vacuolar protein sorting-associated protein 41 n=1 Tax=Trypanosoma theileri TaxID=67003 RepID=A0A1X0P8M2_9TRYP|nr:putative vacuolar protein sorting-associated protein 41 [Trypanosoma theileri]ORC92973.1 putative vacuolar protein sorting-associated protein 41 [Trypanosoma theileri]
MAIASYTRQNALGIPEILCMCVLDNNNVLVACVGTTDLFQLTVDDDTVIITHIYSLELQETAHKVRYISSINSIFLLSGITLCSGILVKSSTSSTCKVCPLIGDDVKDFDLVVIMEGVILSALVGYDISIFLCTGDDAFPLKRFYVGNVCMCNWVTPDCLCCSEFGEMRFYGVDGTHIRSLGSPASKAIYATPLHHYFDNDVLISEKSNKRYFIVLFDGNEGYFSHQLVVFSQKGNTVTEIERFPIFAISRPSCIFSIGPWVCVGGSFGLEFYDYRKGTYAQSSLENVSVTHYSFSNVCIDATIVPNDTLYSRAHYGVAVSKKSIYALCFQSIIDVVDELSSNTAFYSVLLKSLLVFGSSVRAKRTMYSSKRIHDTVSSCNILFSEYGSILSRFHVQLSDFPRRRSICFASTKQPDTCAICGIKSTFTSILCECVICHLIVCRKCSFVRNMKLYGYSSWDKGIVCCQCDGRCDLNLYRLFVARRFTQILNYMEQYPERCYQFSLKKVVPPLLEQCFGERKFELCAELLEKYVAKGTVFWDQWIVRFVLEKEVRALVRVHNPNDADENCNTTILLHLVKCDVKTLYLLIQEWSNKAYNDEIILHGIMSRLSFKKEEARVLQESCQEGSLTFSELQNAIGLLYFDEEVDTLLRVYLYICFRKKRYMDGAKCYMEYFMMMLPFSKHERTRTYEVFEGYILLGQPIRKYPPSGLIDFWDLITSHGILESFIRLKDSTGTTVFLTPLLIHYREEFGRYLVDSLHSDLLEDVLQSVVSDLQESQPSQLLHVLDALTNVSPLATSSYHSLMSELYLEYAPEKLLSFIQNPLVIGLNWKKLAKSVENRKMYRELIYIVGKTGNDMEAVRMAIRCMKSVSLALEYIKDNPNKIHLWNSLVANVIQSPILIGDFLDAVEDFTIVEFLLKSIPEQNRLSIERVGPRLNKALRNKWCTERIDESSVDSMLEDNYTLLCLLRKKSCKGVSYVSNTLCNSCHQIISGERIVDDYGMSFHITCVSVSSNQRSANKERINGRNYRPKYKREVDHEINYVEYYTSRSLGVSNLLLLLPDTIMHHILQFLSIHEREICRCVSRLFRKIISSFYIFNKREDDHISSRYYTRLQENENRGCRQTIYLGKVPILGFSGSTMLPSSSSSS